MKRLSKYILAVMAAICVFSVISCGGPQKLDAPSELQINGTKLSWKAVGNAQGYYVDVDGHLFTANVNSFDLSVLSDTLNTCRIKILARGGDIYIDSDWSEVKNYTPYKTSDKLWLKLSFTGGEIRNYIKFKGQHNGLYYDVYYYDSNINRVPEKRCIVRITEDVYYKYEWKPDNEDVFSWVKISGSLDEKTAGIEAYKYTMFNVLFTGERDGGFVSENVNVDGTNVSCKKYSQTGDSGTSYFWRPDGFDFWIQCRSFNSQGEPLEINAVKLDLNLSSLPDFISLP